MLWVVWFAMKRGNPFLELCKVEGLVDRGVAMRWVRKMDARSSEREGVCWFLL